MNDQPERKGANALTQYSGFSTPKSLDAAEERLKKLRDIVGAEDNMRLLEIAKKSPKKILSILDQLYESIGPRSIGINPTPVCNRACDFCSSMQRNSINIKEGIEIDRPSFENLLKSFKDMGGQGVVLVGGGEALLACDGHLNEVIDNYQLHYGFNTNGVNLDKFDRRGLVEKISWISLSIIGHNKELYNNVAGLSQNNPQFDILEKNMKRYLELAGNGNGPYISAKVLLSRSNHQHAAEMYNYLESLGFKDIALRCVNNFETMNNYRGHELLPQDIELTLEQKTIIGDSLTKTNIEESTIRNIIGDKAFSSLCKYHDLKQTAQNKRMHTMSDVPTIDWNIVLGLMVNIDTDGKVYLCNPRLGQTGWSIGNINEDDFRDVWTSQNHIDIVSRTYKSPIGCDLSMCRHYRVNQTIERYMKGEISMDDRRPMEIKMSYFP